MADDTPLKTVQDYIDERPQWSDGTLVSTAPLTAMQWRIWWLASAGKFFEGLVIFVTGVALPLIAVEFNLDATRKGLVGAASLFGILVGATALGSLADHFGRRVMFIIEMALFSLFLALVSWSPNFTWLLMALFGLGVSLGCDYPTAHMIISESMPSRSRGRLVLSAFGFQALGALAGTAVGLLILQSRESLTDWRWMYATALIPALLVLGGRFFIPQSGPWLASKGRIAEAERETEVLLNRKPPYPTKIRLKESPRGPSEQAGAPKPTYGALFARKSLRATILASVPWFLQDLGTYGIGIFTPTILASTIGVKNAHARNLADLIHNDVLAARGAALIDTLLMVGIVVAVLLADQVGRIRLQIVGFLGCAVGLLLASLSMSFEGATRMFFLFAGFMLFNFMTNLGPNAMTYLIAGEVFPTSIRGVGAGFAASFGKIGAVATSFFFPILLKDLGTSTVLFILIGTSLLGAVITARFRIETRGINLETLGQGPSAATTISDN
jgi:MFS transporter, putative metabolite transport protein